MEAIENDKENGWRKVQVLPMYEFIPSATEREYLEKIGHVFTDSEKATLIYNLGQGDVLCVHKRLRELAAETKDQVLKGQIARRLAYEEACIEKISRDNTPGYLYEVYLQEEADEEEYFSDCFTSFEAAKKHAAQDGSRYVEIKKHRPISSLKKDDGRDVCSYVGRISYIDGILCSFESTECIEEEFLGKGFSTQTSFEDQFVEIPTPFRVGDFISFPDDVPEKKVLCVVTEVPALASDGEQNAGKSWENTHMWVETFMWGKRCSRISINPCETELYELKEKDPGKRILEAAHCLLYGHSDGNLTDFQSER